jgi:hypothetical protein
MKRRSILKGAAGAGLAAGAGAFAILKYPRGLHAAGWGTWPQDKLDAIVPEDLRAQKVLEVHMNGGIGAWDTFYTVPSWGQGADPQGEAAYLHTFEGDTDAQPGYANPQDRFEQCGLDDQPYTAPFQEDGAGTLVHLGPWTAPLRRRPDILARMRIVVQYHDVLAHEGANPISFTGDFLGNPRLAGIGAPIQRYFSEQPGGERAVPYAFVLYPGGAGFSGFNVGSASAIGFHPGSARPLNVTVSQDSVLAQLLSRPGLDQSDPAAFDAAVSFYSQAYENRFRPGGVGKATRSLERGNYAFANYARQNANELIEVLSPDLFAEIQGQTCAAGAAQIPTQNLDMPAMMANVARSLLTRETNRARYVNWIDTGLFSRPEIGYDVHNEHVLYTARSVPHTLQRLADIIRDPNNPTPQDDQLIDLDQTMVVINMEFGRTPYRQVPGSSGTNHWPYGYVNVIIGGPIRDDSRSPGASIYGNIADDGYAGHFVAATENRIMVLSALGIYPFSSQSYAVADVRFSADEIAAATRVRDELWGITV